MGSGPTTSSSAARGAVPVEVKVVEPTGSETHVSAKLAGIEIAIVSKERLSVRPGDTLMGGIGLPRLHVFERAGGRRLQ